MEDEEKNTTNEEEVVEEVVEEVMEEPAEEQEEVKPEEVKEPENVENVVEKKNDSASNKSANFIPLIILIVIVVALFGGCYYFVSNKTPKDIFKTTIRTLKKYTANIATEDISKYKGTLNYSIETNIDELRELADVKRSVVYGIDRKNKKLELGINTTGDDKLGLLVYLKNGKTYVNFKSLNKTICLDDYDSFKGISEELEVLFENSSDISGEDIQYVANKAIDLLADSLVEDKISKKDSEIKVNGKKIKVVKTVYEIDEKVVEKQTKAVIEGLLKDSHSKEILKKIKLEDDKTLYDELDDTEVNKDEIGEVDTKIIIYTTSGFSSIFKGIEIESNDSKISYLTNNGDFDLVFDELGSKVTLKGIKKDDYTQVTLDSDFGKGKFKVRKFEDDNIDLDYNLEANDSEISGTILLKGNKDKFEGKVSVKIENQKLTVKFDNKSSKDDVANYSTKTTKMSESSIYENMISELSDTIVMSTFGSSLIKPNFIGNTYIDETETETLHFIDEYTLTVKTSSGTQDVNYTYEDGLLQFTYYTVDFEMTYEDDCFILDSDDKEYYYCKK